MSIKFSVCALIYNEEGKILAVSRKDNRDDWGLPGGKVDPGEPVFKAILREVKEETGLEIINADFIFGNMSSSGSYYCYTFKCIVKDFSELHTPEKIAELGEGDIKWSTWEELEAGSFGGYNHYLKEVMEKWFEDWINLTTNI